MRLVLCGLSAVLLSGCSWLGGFNQSGSTHHAYKGVNPHHMGIYQQAGARHNPCVIYSPVQPVPQGCDPAQVTLATGPNPYAGQGHGGQYATGGYGSHVGQAGHSYHTQQPRLRKPRLRGSLSLGVERSFQGTFLEPGVIPALDPSASYDPDAFAEGFTTGSIADGNITDVVYTGAIEQVTTPTISFDDVWTNPATISAGMEYIVSPKFTVFANGGYTHAEGNDDAAISVDATLLRDEVSQDYDPVTGLAIGGPVVNTQFIPNQTIANFAYDFSDLRRYNLEVGARKYFDPVVKDQAHRTVTPFVGASIGASHYNAVSAKVNQEQLFYQRAFDNGQNEFYDVVLPTNEVPIYDSEWIPNGSLTAGMEWQVTPGTALALETGVRYEKSRDFVNGASGDDNISIPVTLRGSFNF